MKSISQLRNASMPVLLLLSLVFLLFACKKKEVVNPEAMPPLPQQASFSLLNLEYFLDNGDGKDSTSFKLGAYELRNPSNSQRQQVYFEDFQGLHKQSIFTFTTVQAGLPKNINLSDNLVPTPADIIVKRIYTLYSGWKMTDTLQQKPYDYLEPVNQTVAVPAKSMIQIDRTIMEYWAKVSFRASLKNENTGELYKISGNWKGTLNFSNYSVVLSQKNL